MSFIVSYNSSSSWLSDCLLHGLKVTTSKDTTKIVSFPLHMQLNIPVVKYHSTNIS